MAPKLMPAAQTYRGQLSVERSAPVWLRTQKKHVRRKKKRARLSSFAIRSKPTATGSTAHRTAETRPMLLPNSSETRRYIRRMVKVPKSAKGKRRAASSVMLSDGEAVELFI